MSELHFHPQAYSIVVSARIETKRGIAYADLVFDTGATLVMLPQKLAEAVGLDIDPKKTVKTTTASSIETSPIVTVPSMNVLGVSVENVDCIIRDLPEQSAVDGLLGLSFIRHFNVRLDFKRGILRLEPH